VRAQVARQPRRALHSEGSRERRAAGTAHSVRRSLRSAGRGQRRRAHPRPRRKKGGKSRNAKVAFVGVLRRDLDIGTGVVEGAVRNLVGLRLDGPGMRWGRDRAEMVLHLRCIVLNGQSNDFCAPPRLPLRQTRGAANPSQDPRRETSTATSSCLMQHGICTRYCFSTRK
jgi:hypothetical protein